MNNHVDDMTGCMRAAVVPSWMAWTHRNVKWWHVITMGVAAYWGRASWCLFPNLLDCCRIFVREIRLPECPLSYDLLCTVYSHYARSKVDNRWAHHSAKDFIQVRATLSTSPGLQAKHSWPSILFHLGGFQDPSLWSPTCPWPLALACLAKQHCWWEKTASGPAQKLLVEPQLRTGSRRRKAECPQGAAGPYLQCLASLEA